MRRFPRDFLDIVENAEEGGRTPEVMEKQAEYYQEESSIRLRVLMRFAGFGVWAAVAILLIVMIFRIFITAYLGPLEQIHREMGV